MKLTFYDMNEIFTWFDIIEIFTFINTKFKSVVGEVPLIILYF